MKSCSKPARYKELRTAVGAGQCARPNTQDVYKVLPLNLFWRNKQIHLKREQVLGQPHWAAPTAVRENWEVVLVRGALRIGTGYIRTSARTGRTRQFSHGAH